MPRGASPTILRPSKGSQGTPHWDNSKTESTRHWAPISHRSSIIRILVIAVLRDSNFFFTPVFCQPTAILLFTSVLGFEQVSRVIFAAKSTGLWTIRSDVCIFTESLSTIFLKSDVFATSRFTIKNIIYCEFINVLTRSRNCWDDNQKGHHCLAVDENHFPSRDKIVWCFGGCFSFVLRMTKSKRLVILRNASPGMRFSTSVFFRTLTVFFAENNQASRFLSRRR